MENRIVHWARIAYLVVAWLFVAAVIVQVFLAGLGVFAGAANWRTHVRFGWGIAWLPLILILLALVGRLPGAVGRWLALLFVVYAVQTMLPGFRRDTPVVAALHPVNALAVFGIALIHARRAWSLVRGQRETAVTLQRPVESTES